MRCAESATGKPRRHASGSPQTEQVWRYVLTPSWPPRMRDPSGMPVGRGLRNCEEGELNHARPTFVICMVHFACVRATWPAEFPLLENSFHDRRQHLDLSIHLLLERAGRAIHAVGERLDPAGAAADLHAAAGVAKGHRVLPALEAHETVVAHGARHRDVEGLGQDGQRRELMLLSLPRLDDARDPRAVGDRASSGHASGTVRQVDAAREADGRRTGPVRPEAAAARQARRRNRTAPLKVGRT